MTFSVYKHTTCIIVLCFSVIIRSCNNNSWVSLLRFPLYQQSIDGFTLYVYIYKKIRCASFLPINKSLNVRVLQLLLAVHFLPGDLEWKFVPLLLPARSCKRQLLRPFYHVSLSTSRLRYSSLLLFEWTKPLACNKILPVLQVSYRSRTRGCTKWPYRLLAFLQSWSHINWFFTDSEALYFIQAVLSV